MHRRGAYALNDLNRFLTASPLGNQSLDPILKNDKFKRLEFLKTLFDLKLVGVRRKVRAKAGIFFVHKKDGMRRCFYSTDLRFRLFRGFFCGLLSLVVGRFFSA